MGEYEPNDSRNVTLNQDRAPGEPPRTGPREGETRQGRARPVTELDPEKREAEEAAMRRRDAEQRQAEHREAAMERDTQELNEAEATRRDEGI
ncbi:MAG TPA: hypothetical protein VKY80_03945 [Croceibacterium sp.]|nr:hypothetical protein [Croceibacterium sp.]